MPFGRRSSPKPAPRRKSSPADQYNDLLRRYTSLHASYTELVANLPARDAEVAARMARKIAKSVQGELPKRDHAIEQRLLDDLANGGFLRERPAKPTRVRRVLRNAAGQIEGLVDSIERVESRDDDAA